MVRQHPGPMMSGSASHPSRRLGDGSKNNVAATAPSRAAGDSSADDDYDEDGDEDEEEEEEEEEEEDDDSGHDVNDDDDDDNNDDEPHEITKPGYTTINGGASNHNLKAGPSVQPATQSGVGQSSTKPTLQDLEDKYAHLFIQRKDGPEQHRPQRINGPLQAPARDRKPAPPPFYSTLPGPEGSAGNPIPIRDQRATYSYTPGISAGYVDPRKATADLKALMEGALEDEEEAENKDKLAEKGEDRSQILGLKVRLLRHQIEGVEWMRGRELGPVKTGRVPKGGILADDMGLGKTIQAISLILTNTKARDSTKHAGVDRPTLVVAPLALIRQWEAELKDKIEPSHRLKVLVHHGPQRTKRPDDLRRYDVVITTYQILVSEHGKSSESLKAGCFGLHWWRVILDEAHTVKNRNAKSTKACYELRSEYRWCLSGTPMQNNLEELQSLIKFLRIKPYDDVREWKENIEQPMKNGKGDVAIKRLHTVLRCFMKRRTKDILKEPGALQAGRKGADGADGGGESTTSGFKITERKVVSVETVFSPAERRFYDRLEQRTDKSLENMMRTQGKVSYVNALLLLLRLRQVCNHPKLVEGKLDKDKDALATDTKPKKGDKGGEADVDTLADLFGGLGVETKYCDICGWELKPDTRAPGKDMCQTCFDDLEYFNKHDDNPAASSTAKTKSKKAKSKITKVVREKVKTEIVKRPQRKPRNRRAVLDSDEDEAEDEDEAGGGEEPPRVDGESDRASQRRPNRRPARMDSEDEDEEASWIVSGDERGPLRLGKAGGTDDENAEGVGEEINSEDSQSEQDTDEEESQLDSFISRDTDTRSGHLPGAGLEESDSDSDEFESISVIASQPMLKRAAGNIISESESASDEQEADDSETDSDQDQGSESDSDDQGPNPFSLARGRGGGGGGGSGGGKKEKTPTVLASAKIRQLLTILQREMGEHKFIVFSQFTSMLDIIARFLRKDGIRHARYDGAMRNDEREAALAALRHDPATRVLLCSLRCGALGLNLTAASRVVIVEPFWNPFVEEQAIDRVHRLTQTVDVVVYKLTVAHTVEERILELQARKRELARQAIEQGGAARKDALRMGVDEMMGLFRHGGGGARSSGGGSGSSRMDTYTAGLAADRRLAAATSASASASTAPRQESAIYGRRW